MSCQSYSIIKCRQCNSLPRMNVNLVCSTQIDEREYIETIRAYKIVDRLLHHNPHFQRTKAYITHLSLYTYTYTFIDENIYFWINNATNISVFPNIKGKNVLSGKMIPKFWFSQDTFLLQNSIQNDMWILLSRPTIFHYTTTATYV